MVASPLVSAVVMHLGPVPVTRPVVTTWGIVAVLGSASWLATRRLERLPGRRQAVVEIVVTVILDQIEAIIGRGARTLLPLLGTMFIFVLAANISGLLPGVEAPTARIETPAALTLIVFGSVQVFGVRSRGVLGYLAGFAKPRALMLPLNLLGEVTRTFSMMVRLFGNVMSGEFLIGLVVALAGLFLPIPLMVLELIVGVVQAYIFTVLATVFIGGAMTGEPA